MAQTPPPPRRLGERLVQEGLLTPEQLRIALELQKRTSKLLGEILVDLGFVEETVLSSLFSHDLGAPHMASLEGVSVDPEAVRLIPKEWALEHKVLPLSCEDNELTVAVTDPFDVVTVDEIRKKTGRRVRTVVASETEILRAVEFWYTGGQDPLREILQQAHEALSASGGGPAVEEAPLIRLVNHMLTMAAKDGATDVHLEPERNAVLVRFRVDGILKVWQILPKELERTLVSRLKVMANLDISETRLPQDGRAEFRFGNRPLDLRVSAYPTSQGENVVIRILDRRKLVTRIDELGFSEDLRATLRRLLGRHQGIILVTGPTGSGKTTTLYASLMEIASPQINIMTIEDPIE
jgi:type IV pilus assembly protein PilB